MEKGQDIRHTIEVRHSSAKVLNTRTEDFVLEKSIFNNVFEKDIRRVFIYKKAERLAKAIHLITPAFVDSMSLKDRIDAVAVGLVDAAILPSSAARMKLSRELLTLSSILSIAHAGGLLSSMNAELIARETRILLQEVAEYEEPRLSLDETPTLSEMAKKVVAQDPVQRPVIGKRLSPNVQSREPLGPKGHIKDRSESIMSVIRNKKTASIKDISTVIRGVSEKTIQRDLLSLVAAGTVLKQGERRWSTYSLAQ